MKYKLTQAAIEELKAMEFEKGWTYDRAIKMVDKLFDLFVIDAKFEIFEPIAEKVLKEEAGE